MEKTPKNKDAVSQKILETAKETERLKQELEALIASGIRGRQPVIPTTSQIVPLESTNKFQIIKSYDPKHSHHVKKPLLEAPNTAASEEGQSVSPRKPKTYNVDDAREYIKKQREKRIAELKNRKTYTQITAEIRREKLQELQQKASEIVKKNVEAKRARSKSREPPIVRSRSASREPVSLKSRSRSGEKRVLAQEESVIEGFNCAGKTRKHIVTHSDINMKSKRNVPENKPGKVTSMDALNTLGKNSTRENILQNNKELDIPDSSVRSRNLNLLHAPKLEFGFSEVKTQYASLDVDGAKLLAKNQNPLQEGKSGNHESQTSDKEPEKRSLKCKLSSQNSQSNHSLWKSSEPSEVQADVSHKSTKRSSSKHSSENEKVNVISNITLRSASGTSAPPEVRDECRRTPDWLKEQPQADPYNFINTVKRRLKYVVNANKPTFVDAAVQGSLEDINSPLQSSKSSRKTDLKSFISHKCLHLDPKAIEHIELERNKLSAFKDGPTITKPSSCSENDSDTSKNIPSIFSESGSSLRRNAEFIKQSDLKPLENIPQSLDVRKVEDIKIKKSEISSSLLSVPLQDDVERIKKQLFKDSENYSSEFIATDLSRSRESIISFNCAKVSPNKVPFFVPDNQEEGSDSVVLSEPAFLGSDTSVLNEADTTSSNRLSKASEYSLTRNITTRSITERSKINLPQGKAGNSVNSDEGSQKFISLLSSLHPSSNVSEFKQSRTSDDVKTDSKLRENTNCLSGRSEKLEFHGRQVGNDESRIIDPKSSVSDGSLETPIESLETISSRSRTRSDSIVNVCGPKISATGSAGSQHIYPEVISEQVKARGSTELHRSKSEKSISEKPEKNVFSKSESNIYAGREQTEESKLSVNVRKRSKNVDSDRQALMRNITIRSCDNSRENLSDTNEINLKFEAEIHLLTDFNQTIRRFSEIEKTFESLRSQNDNEAKKNKALENKDTQTSILSTSSPTKITTEDNASRKSKSSMISEVRSDRPSNSLHLTKRSGINFESLNLDLTQASDMNSVLSTVNFEDSLLDNASVRTSSVIHFSQLDVDASSREKSDIGEENAVFKSVAGMSLRMFDQLIKDEDARIENWKKLIKIREQALLDRTRGELVWLEMQKKHLIETGKLSEASLIKKKQRGILLKHQQEKHEMQRLKQMQKEDSQNRKALLKKERNKIKNQLLSDNMLSKLKSNIHRDRSEKRLSGPFKVIQSTGTTVHSETSLSKGTGGTDQEIKSITTRTSRTHSVVNILSETSDNYHTDMESIDLRSQNRAISAGTISNMKKTLLMREHALAKRRKTVEELLQWHKKLLDEEKAIADLESKIGTIISKIPSQANAETPKKSRTPSVHTSNSVSSGEVSAAASMSHLTLERPQIITTNLTTSKTATSISSQITKNIPQEEIHSEDSNKIVSSSNNYSADFEVEAAPQNSDDKSSVSSISQLIEDFSKIEDHILNLSLMPKRQPPSEDENIPHDEVTSAVSPHSTAAANGSVAQEIASNQNDTDASVVFVEEASERSFTNTEQDKVESFIEIEEVSEESPTKDSEIKSSDKEQKSVSEQVITNKVPDDSLSSKSTSVDIEVEVEVEVINNAAEEANDSVAGEISEGKTLQEQIEIAVDVPDAEVCQAIQRESQTDILVEEENLNNIERVDDSEREHKSEAGLKDNLIGDLEASQISSHSSDIAEPLTSVKEHNEVSIITEPSQSLSKQEEVCTPLIPPISNEYELQRPDTPSRLSIKDDASTSKPYEEIDDSVASIQPSSSHLDTDSPVLTLGSKEEDCNASDEKDHDNPSSSSGSIAEVEIHLPSAIEDGRQSFENKTDEEKAASLSGKSSEGSRGVITTESLRHSAAEETVHPCVSLTSSSDASVASESGERLSPKIKTDDTASENKSATELGNGSSPESSQLATEVTLSAENSNQESICDSNKASRSSEPSAIYYFNTPSEVSTTVSQESSSPTRSPASSDKPSVSPTQTKSPADIKKHVQEILNVSSPASRDKSPRMQDLCLITYDTSPVQSPESGSPLDDRKTFSLGSEAEELHRKQLAIEQEIKLLKEQQKEAPAAFYIREIPNKPPPPYTPPSKTRTPKTPSIIPGTKEEIEQITEYSAKIIYKAYLSRNLENITISDNTLNLIAKNIDKGCYKYVFDLCKEIAREHYNQFVEEAGPSWLHLDKKTVLTPVKPLDVNGLKKHLSKKLFQMFGFEKHQNRRENAIMKWSRKKRDHVDEVLVQEMQAEEDTWTNFDRDEALVKDRITNEIMEMLLKETVEVLKKTVQKKMEGQ